MSRFQTYVTVTVSCDGSKPSEITRKLQELGFRPTYGIHDFVYDWKEKNIALEQIIEFADKVQKKLKGTGAMLHFTTVK